jgi:hypothetical protein
MRAKPAAAALIPVAMALTVTGLLTRERMPERVFGLSGDALSGMLMGMAIGLLLVALVLGARARRS